MSLRTMTLIECNGPGCTETLTVRAGAHRVTPLTLARAAGWVRLSDAAGVRRDLCPACQIEAKRRHLREQLAALGGDGE